MKTSENRRFSYIPLGLIYLAFKKLRFSVDLHKNIISSLTVCINAIIPVTAAAAGGIGS
jgi:hypothetical protein